MQLNNIWSRECNSNLSKLILAIRLIQIVSYISAYFIIVVSPGFENQFPSVFQKEGDINTHYFSLALPILDTERLGLNQENKLFPLYTIVVRHRIIGWIGS